NESHQYEKYRTYAKPSQRCHGSWSYDVHGLHRHTLLERFCVSRKVQNKCFFISKNLKNSVKKVLLAGNAAVE
ncbi:MAG: hypothetical protein KGM99_15805, partial [Burkholderiales bacterium]|nr:hypothetical protein [Burkholderiales bacterium]